MPVHGDTPDEVLSLYTRAGGSWWLVLGATRFTGSSGDVLSDIPALEVPRDATAWADPIAGQVSHATGVTMPGATSTTTAAAWALYNDEALTDLALSRWLSTDRVVPAGHELELTPEVLTIEFSPQA